jgi:hypothetical protein
MNLENEEAKARCRAVKIQPQWVVTAGKQTDKRKYKFNTITNKYIIYFKILKLIPGNRRTYNCTEIQQTLVAVDLRER